MRLALLVLTACGRLGFDASEIPIDADIDAPDADVDELCDPSVQGDTVALYLFEDDLSHDTTGKHPGQPFMNITNGAPRCGANALQLSTGYIRVPHADDLNLQAGSIEMFVLARSLGTDNQTFLARDALGSGDGHLIVILTTAGELVVRLQAGGVSYYRCAPFPLDRWVHLALSFGAPDLRAWVDGNLATLPTATIESTEVACGAPITAGIAGNTNTLIIGASNARLGNEGEAEPAIDQYVLDGQIDHVHIRSTWRDFGGS